jgi:hypothetical protein
MKMLYKYPERAFPYNNRVESNRQRGKDAPEYELFDTGIFDENRYFDVFVEYAKVSAEDILIRITAFNRGPEAADLHILPTLWFRNTWSWGREHDQIPRLKPKEISSGKNVKWMEAYHATLGRYVLACEAADTLLFTENETNSERLFNFLSPYGIRALSRIYVEHPYALMARHTPSPISPPNRTAVCSAVTSTRAVPSGSLWITSLLNHFNNSIITTVMIFLWNIPLIQVTKLP